MVYFSPIMKLTRNIYKVLAAVLLTAGLAVFAMGGVVGHFVLSERVKIEKKQVVEKAHEVQVKNEAVKLKLHRNLYKRVRNRSGLDLDFTTYTFEVSHPKMIGLPERYEASIHTAILVTSSLRGPPCA